MRKALLLVLAISAIAVLTWMARVGGEAPPALAMPPVDGEVPATPVAPARRADLESARADATESAPSSAVDHDSRVRRSSAIPAASFPCRGSVFEWVDGKPKLYRGAELHFSLEVDGDEIWSTEVVAGEGVFEVAVPSAGLHPDSRPVVVLVARAPLHLPVRVQSLVAFRGAAPTPMRKEVRLGATAPVLTGRVLDPRGEPVANPPVQLWRVDGTEPERQFGPYAELNAIRGARGYMNGNAYGDPGEYAVQVTPGAVYQIAVQHEVLGVGALGPIRVGEADAVLPDLRLRGANSLEGRVLLPDGEPATRLGLRLEIAEPLRLSNGTLVELGERGMDPAYAILELAGLPSAMQTTDREGRFRFDGLGPWPYELSGTEGAIVLQGAGPYRGSHEDLHVVVGVYVVRVKVTAEDGSVPRYARLGHRSWTEPAASLRAALHAPDFHASADARGAQRSGTEEKDWWWTTSRPGEVFRFDASAPGFRPGFAVVEVRRETYEYSVNLELARDDLPAAPVVLDLSRYPPRPRPRVELTSHQTGIAHRVSAATLSTFGSGRFNTSREPPELTLRAGTYDLRIAQEEDTGFVFPLEDTIEVLAGQPLTLRPDARVGGRIRVEGVLETALTEAGSVELEWLPDEGESHVSTARIPSGSARYAIQSGVLEPGSGRLRVQIRGRDAREQPLEVLAGELTEISLQLGR